MESLLIKKKNRNGPIKIGSVATPRAAAPNGTVAIALHGQRFPMPPYEVVRCELFN